MEYAFSLVKDETLHVDEFLKLDGDSGYLIGRNLIVCDECRRNVYLNKGDKIKPYFSHYKESDEAKKVCKRRVNGYSEHYVRQLNKRRSKLRVGYFQQRFEDLIFLTIIELFEKTNRYFATYGAFESQPNDEGIVLLKVNDENKLWLLDHLREILRLSFKAKSDTVKESTKQIEKFFEQWSEDVDLFEKLFVLSRKDVVEDNFWSSFNFSLSENNLKFAKEIIRYLNTKHAKPLFHCLYVASLFLSLSIASNKLHHFNVPDSNEREKLFGTEFFDKDWLESFIDDQKTEPRLKNLLLLLLLEFDRIKTGKKDVSGNIKNLFEKFLSGKTPFKKNDIEGKKVELISNTDKRWYLGHNNFDIAFTELVGFSLKIFSICDLASIARRNYGDDMETPDELLLNATAKNRGFIYIAWTPFGKTMWEKQLKEKSFSDAVKIGKSDDPERRKKEIAGNFAPPDSVEIIDYYPVLDMSKAENYVHNNLKRFRLSSNREVFGLDKENANELVNNIMKNFYKK